MSHEVEIDWLYEPRWYQEEFENAMFNGYKAAVLTWHRRSGKDIACFNFMLHQAAIDRVGAYFYVFPTYAQGRKAIWDAIDERGNRFLDFVPKQILRNLTKQEMKIELVNGSYIQIIGSFDFDKVRGTNAVGVVFSENAYQSPAMYEAVFAPILAKNGGWVVFNSTPQGRNHHFDLFEKAKKFPDTWYASLLTVEITGLLTPVEIEKIAEEGKMSYEFIQQEFYCSFDMGVKGSIYGRYVEVMRKEGRIGPVNLDIDYPVYTAWDLGFGDSTSIIFFQRRGNQILIIDQLEDHHRPLSYFFNEVAAKKYRYAGHYFPHDGKQHELVSGFSAVQAAIDFGLENVTAIPNKLSIEMGIEKVRRILPRVLIDEKKCDFGIRCLLQYHYEWDEKFNAAHSKPKHDWSSHFCDALRMLAISLDLNDNTQVTKEQIDDYWRESLGLKDKNIFDTPGWQALS